MEKNNKTNLSNESIRKCYVCGKCTAGCPLAFKVDMKPHEVLRLLQLGYKDEVLKSKMIWYCSSCGACFSRCPNEVDLPHIMDNLIKEANRGNIVNKDAKSIKKFYQSFINNISNFGISNEFFLVLEHKIRTKRFFQDFFIAPVLFLKGKIKLIPKFKGTKVVKKVFRTFWRD